MAFAGGFARVEAAQSRILDAGLLVDPGTDSYYAIGDIASRVSEIALIEDLNYHTITTAEQLATEAERIADIASTTRAAQLFAKRMKTDPKFKASVERVRAAKAEAEKQRAMHLTWLSAFATMFGAGF